MEDTVSKAIIFATKAHQGQKRKGSEIPYILHPLEAGIIASQLTEDVDIICAAILHDVIEDTEESYETIKATFNERVADFVGAESEDKSKTWKERKGATIDKIKTTPYQEIKILTLCDKLSNIRAMHRDYGEIGDELWNRFNVKDKKMHAWYYLGLLEGFASLKGTKAYAEYEQLAIEVFR